MSYKGTIKVAVLSSVITVLLLLAIFAFVSSTLAQNGSQGEPADPNTPLTTEADVQSPLDPNNLGQPLITDAPKEENAPEAVTHYTHVSGSVFGTLYSDATYNYGGSGCVYMAGVNRYLNFPLQMPYKTTVTQMRLYFKDTNASQNGIMWLAQYDDGLNYTYVVTATTAGSAGWGTATVSLNKTLDYDNYSYAMVWSPIIGDSTMQLCGFRIGYSVPVGLVNYLPMIDNNFPTP